MGICLTGNLAPELEGLGGLTVHDGQVNGAAVLAGRPLDVEVAAGGDILILGRGGHDGKAGDLGRGRGGVGQGRGGNSSSTHLE